MSYRFTNTEKWDDTWFCDLKPLSKLLFLYLCDRCDMAGFLEINKKKISFDLGLGKQEVESGLQGIEDKIIFSKDKKYLYVTNFLKHQKNIPFNEKNRAHLAIKKIFDEKIQLFEYQNNILGCLGGYIPLIRGTGHSHSIGNKEGGMGGEKKYYQSQKEKLLSKSISIDQWGLQNKVNTEKIKELITEFIEQKQRFEETWETDSDMIKNFEFWLKKVCKAKPLDKNNDQSLNTNTFDEPTRPKIII